jgi:3',5'-cyclic AMP phosphodiesterase CpdA
MIPDARADDQRVVFVTDLHLSLRRPYYQDNWDMVVAWINAEKPPLVVVGGDVVLGVPDDNLEDLDYAREQLARLEVPWRVIPGNHDIGDNIVSGGMDARVSTERRQVWLDRFGIDYWREDIGEWSLIGVNAQIFNGQGLAADLEQQAWLEATLAEIEPHRPIALFVHKPLFTDHPSDPEVQYHSLELQGRRQLLAPFGGKRLRLVACGHKHQFRSFDHDGVKHIWAPSTSSINHPPTVKMWGLREVGFIDFRLGQGEALGRVRHALIGREFLFRHESYIRIAEYGSVTSGPEQVIL